MGGVEPVEQLALELGAAAALAAVLPDGDEGQGGGDLPAGDHPAQQALACAGAAGEMSFVPVSALLPQNETLSATISKAVRLLPFRSS